MSEITLQLQLNTGTTAAPGAPIVFDEDMPSGNISYDSATGEITLSDPGRYVFEWWVATQSSTTIAGTAFSLESTQGIYGSAPRL